MSSCVDTSVLIDVLRGDSAATASPQDARRSGVLHASEITGNLGRQWLPSHRGTDAADLVVAATTINLGIRLLTRNVRHFPMFEGLTPPN